MTWALGALGALTLLACEGGVLPLELKELGSLESARYTARHIYPAHGVETELIWPRLGSPALLLPEDDRITVTFYAAATVDPTPLTVSALAPGLPTTTLPLLTTPACDSDRICTVEVDPTALPEDTLLELCVNVETARACRRGGLWRFAHLPVPLRLAVITDVHLESGKLDSGGARLQRIFDGMARADPPPDLVAVLGDTADHGALQEQQRFVEIARESTLPMLVLPGNHDFKDGNIVHYLRHVNPHLDHATRLGPYLLIGLNTGPGLKEETGHGSDAQSAGLEAAQVAWLRALTDTPGVLPLVMTHHPPWSASWFVMGRRRRAFLDACRHGGVRLILSGHTHRNEVFDHAGLGNGLSTRCESDVPEGRLPVTVISAPSTEPHMPGYRLVELHADGHVGYCYKGVNLD